jgi:hypothetical protein
MGGLLMLSIFIVLACLLGFAFYQCCSRIDCNSLMGLNNRRQRIEHSNDLPKSSGPESIRMESADASYDANFKSHSNLIAIDNSNCYPTKETSFKASIEMSSHMNSSSLLMAPNS